MDPVSALGLVGSIVSIADVVLRTANRLSLLQTKYRQADVSVSLLIGQLCTIQAALRQLADSEQFNFPCLTSPGSDGMVELSTSLDGCSMLVTSLDKQLNELERRTRGELSTRGKISFLWREREIRDYLDLLDRHVNALNLLLHVIQCKTSAEQRILLGDKESVKILRLARECTESLYTLDGNSTHFERSSIFSQDTVNLSTKFDFDLDLLGTRAYHAAFKRNFRDLVHGKANLQQVQASQNNEETVEQAIAYAKSNKMETTRQILPQEPSATGKLSPEMMTTFQAMSLTTKPPSKHSTAPRLRKFALSPSPITSRSNSPMGPAGKTAATLPPSRLVLQEQPEVKALLLGTSESGKSTLLKAIKVWGEQDCTREERDSFKEIVLSNVVCGMKIILEAVMDLDIPLHDGSKELHIHTIFVQPDLMGGAEVLPKEVGSALKALWADEGIQEAYGRRREYQLLFALAYYIDNIDRIGAISYVPSTKDILMSRVKTTGITETTFTELSKQIWRVFDVGGTRSERKKWIHCFENTDLIIFTVDICCYDKTLFEDHNANRMEETLKLWESIVNSRWFKTSAFVLLFTNMDQLASCLAESQPQPYFQELIEDASVEGFQSFLVERFLSLVTDRSSTVNVLFESLTDDPCRAASRVLALGEMAIQGDQLDFYSSLYEWRTALSLNMSKILPSQLSNLDLTILAREQLSKGQINYIVDKAWSLATVNGESLALKHVQTVLRVERAYPALRWK